MKKVLLYIILLAMIIEASALTNSGSLISLGRSERRTLA